MRKKQFIYGAVPIIAVFTAIIVAGNSGSAAQNYTQVPIILDARKIVSDILSMATFWIRLGNSAGWNSAGWVKLSDVDRI